MFLLLLFRRFKEISEAYEVLSDDKKRKIFDKYGRDGLTANGGSGARSGGHSAHRHHHGHQHFGTFDDEDDDFGNFGFSSFAFRDPFDIFREFFGGADPFEDFMDPFGGFGMMGGGGMARNRQNGFGGGTSLVMRHNNRRSGHFPMSTAMSPFAACGGFGFGLPGFGMGFGGFGGGGFEELDNGGGFTSVQTFSSGGFGGAPVMSMRSSSTSTR